MAASKEKEPHKETEEIHGDQDGRDDKNSKKGGRKKPSSSGWSKIKKAVDAKVDSAGWKGKPTDEKSAPETAPRDTLEEQFLRLRADFDNYRKRTARERDELYRRANEDILSELLPVMDHLEMALNAVYEHGADDAFVAGVNMVSEQLAGVLGKFGLRPIDAGGLEFNHDEHEAISHIPSEDVPENVVMAQVRRGYFLGDKLLRAAQVVVSSGSGTSAAGSLPEDNGGM